MTNYGGPPTDIPKESPRSILFQFVIFPLGIVCVAVVIFLLFGKLATEEHTIPDYLNAIRSGSAHERWQAAYQLSKSLKRGEAARYPNLEQQVAAIYVQSKHDDPRIRRYLSMVLGTLGDRRATPVLLDGLDDRDVDNRLYTLIALGQLRDPAAVPRIVQAANDEERDVRKAAYYALGEIGDPRAIPALVHGLDDEVADVRWNAAISLSQFGDRRAIPLLREMLDRTRLNQIRDMREDQKEDAMIVAMSAYAKLAGPEARSELERLARDPSLRVQAAAKEALGKLPSS
jgi:HEAT repeat protein